MKKLPVFLIAALLCAASASAQQSVVAKVRRTYPASSTAQPLSDAQHVLLLQDVARALGPDWGVLARKRNSGNVCRLPGDSTLYTCDHVCRLDGTEHVDVLADEEGEARAAWGENGPVPTSRVCVAVPGNVVQPTPDPPSPDPGPDPDPPLPANPDFEKVLLGISTIIGHQGDLVAGHDLILEELVKIRTSLEEHRKVAREELDKAKGWFQRWVVEKILPVVGGIIAGWQVGK